MCACPADPILHVDARLMKLYDELAGGEGGAAAIAALNRALDVVVKKYESLEAVAVTSLQEDLTHLTVSVNSACPLRDDLPCALNNGGRRLRRLDMRRIPGYYGDPSVPAPIHGELLSKLQFGTNTGSVGIAIVNVMGSGKTKAAYDLLRVTCIGLPAGHVIVASISVLFSVLCFLFPRIHLGSTWMLQAAKALVSCPL